jgi:hypothetical protein
VITFSATLLLAAGHGRHLALNGFEPLIGTHRDEQGQAPPTSIIVLLIAILVAGTIVAVVEHDGELLTTTAKTVVTWIIAGTALQSAVMVRKRRTDNAKTVEDDAVEEVQEDASS